MSDDEIFNRIEQLALTQESRRRALLFFKGFRGGADALTEAFATVKTQSEMYSIVYGLLVNLDWFLQVFADSYETTPDKLLDDFIQQMTDAPL